MHDDVKILRDWMIENWPDPDDENGYEDLMWHLESVCRNLDAANDADRPISDVGDDLDNELIVIFNYTLSRYRFMCGVSRKNSQYFDDEIIRIDKLVDKKRTSWEVDFLPLLRNYVSADIIYLDINSHVDCETIICLDVVPSCMAIILERVCLFAERSGAIKCIKFWGPRTNSHLANLVLFADSSADGYADLLYELLYLVRESSDCFWDRLPLMFKSLGPGIGVAEEPPYLAIGSFTKTEGEFSFFSFRITALMAAFRSCLAERAQMGAQSDEFKQLLDDRIHAHFCEAGLDADFPWQQGLPVQSENPEIFSNFLWVYAATNPHIRTHYDPWTKLKFRVMPRRLQS